MEERNYKVILIDDEIWALRGLKNIIRWEDYNFIVTHTFTDSEEALHTIIESEPDVIFTDIRMPNINGMDLIEAIQHSGLRTEIVIVSAYRDFEVAKRAIAKGVLDYLMKPLDREEVKAVLKRVGKTLEQQNDKNTFDITHYDFSSEITLKKQEVQFYLQSITTTPCCWLIVSNSITVPECLMMDFDIHEIFMKGYKHAFLYSGNSPLQRLKSLESVGISRKYRNFLEIPQMLSDAAASLQGHFIFSDNKVTAQIQEYLYTHSAEKITMPHLSEQFFLSESYIFELFRKNTDTTIMNFLKNLRLYQAAELLSLKKLTVKEVSEKVGYSDVGYFGKLFRKKFMCTPEQYSLKP